MNILVDLIIFSCLIWCVFSTNVTENINVNATDQTTDEGSELALRKDNLQMDVNEKTAKILYRLYINKILVQDKVYTGTVVTSRAIVSDPGIENNFPISICDMSIANVTSRVCENASEIDQLKDDDGNKILSVITYGPMKIKLPLIFRGNLSKANCVSIGIDHEKPNRVILTPFEKSFQVECPDKVCNLYDAIICDSELAGVVVKASQINKFKLAPIEFLKERTDKVVDKLEKLRSVDAEDRGVPPPFDYYGGGCACIMPSFILVVFCSYFHQQ